MTIEETMAEWPETVPVFQLLGLDAGCSGTPIRLAAEERGMEATRVLITLNRRRKR